MKQFYMVYVWGKSAPVVRHNTLKGAVDEADRLRTLTDHAIYILKSEHCLEGLEPPKSESKKAKDKEYWTHFKRLRQEAKSKKALDEKAVL